MAKKKSSRKSKGSARKTTRSMKASVKNKDAPLFSIRKSHMTKAGWFFVNLLIISMFVYSIYLLWVKPWTQGVSLIVALLIIIFFIRIYYKLKRK